MWYPRVPRHKGRTFVQVARRVTGPATAAARAARARARGTGRRRRRRGCGGRRRAFTPIMSRATTRRSSGPRPASARARPPPAAPACGGLITAVKFVDPEHAEVGDGEGAARQLRRRDRPVAHLLGQRAWSPRRSRPATCWSASKTVGTTSASCAGDRHADVDARVELDAGRRGRSRSRAGTRAAPARTPSRPCRCRSAPAGPPRHLLEALAQLDRLGHVDLRSAR